MVHVADKNHNHDLFNEAFMMHTSTSPQYSIIASLDVASAMMATSGTASLSCNPIDISLGLRLIDSTVTEAIIFRKAVVDMATETPEEVPNTGLDSVR